MCPYSSPRIAIVIPCFNDHATVTVAVESALAQEPCEIVVVDDGSTDQRTKEVLRTFASDDVCVLHQENQGPSAARMTGVRETTAQYVFPLDADDVLLPNSLTILADYLDVHDDVGVVWGRYRFIGEKSHVKDAASVLDPWALTYFNDIPALSMIRREALMIAGGWQLAVREDYDLWMGLAECGVTGHGLPDVIFCHRLHGFRRAKRAAPKHEELQHTLNARHRSLLSARKVNRDASPAPRIAKIVIPLIYSLTPLTLYRRTALAAYVYRLADPHRRRFWGLSILTRVRHNLRLGGWRALDKEAR